MDFKEAQGLNTLGFLYSQSEEWKKEKPLVMH